MTWSFKKNPKDEAKPSLMHASEAPSKAFELKHIAKHTFQEVEAPEPVPAGAQESTNGRPTARVISDVRIEPAVPIYREKSEPLRTTSSAATIPDATASLNGPVPGLDVFDTVSAMSEVYPDQEPFIAETSAASLETQYTTVGVVTARLGGKKYESPTEQAENPVPAGERTQEKQPGLATPANAPKSGRRFFWSRAKKSSKETKPKHSSHKSLDGPRPIKVLIGFLPDTSERDTFFYVLGVAQKNLDSENIGWTNLQRVGNGYAYEIYEGGGGRGYLESILNYFDSLPPFSAEETHRAYIRTSTRTIRVERTISGLYSVILPESDVTPQSDWLTLGKKMTPLVEKRTGLLIAGGVIFASSLIALIGGFATRYIPYTASYVNIVRVPVAKLPHSQWTKLTTLPAGDYVTALKFERNEWFIQTPSNPSGKMGPRNKVAGGGPPHDGAGSLPPTGVPLVTRGVPSATAPAQPSTHVNPSLTAPSTPPAMAPAPLN